MRLYPHQRAAQQAIRVAYLDGLRRMIVAIATGGGKTMMAIDFAHSFLLPGQRCLWLCHRRLLAEQAYATFQRVFAPDQVGRVMGIYNDVAAPIIVAIDKSMAQPHRLRQAGTFDLVILDEAHHALSPLQRRLLDHVVGDETVLLGLTATPYRSDQQSLRQVFRDGIVYAVGLLDLLTTRDPVTGQPILSDILPPVIVTVDDLDLSQAHKRFSDDFDAEAATEAVLASRTFDAALIAAWQREAADRRTLAYAQDRRHAVRLAAAFVEAGIRAAVVLGTQSETEQQAILHDALLDRSIQVAVTVDLAFEGLDVPHVDCLLIARVVRSRLRLEQLVGRGTRRFPGKANCLIIQGADVHVTILPVTDLIGDMQPAAQRTARRVLEERLSSERTEPPVWRAYAEEQRHYTVRLSAAPALFTVPTTVGVWTAQRGQLALQSPVGRYVLEQQGPDAWRVWRETEQRRFALPRDDEDRGVPLPLRLARAVAEQDAHQRITARADRQTARSDPQTSITPATLARAQQLKLRLVTAEKTEAYGQAMIALFYRLKGQFWPMFKGQPGKFWSQFHLIIQQQGGNHDNDAVAAGDTFD